MSVLRWWMCGASLLIGCTSGDATPDDPPDTDETDGETDESDPPAPTWQEVASDLGGGLLSITGTSTSDVWSVGADDGTGPLVLHFDGAAWTRIDTEGTGDLWWVWRASATSLWSVGEDGRVLHWTDDVLDETVVDAPRTFFGVWGTSDTDVWVVGGDVSLGANGASVWRLTGSEWAEVELPEAAAAQIAIYKVWGTATDDVWMCGSGGVILHWNGDELLQVASDTTRDLFTVAGDEDSVFAVGGIGNAAIVALEDGTWHDESPDFAPAFNGVSVRGDQIVTVGAIGAVWSRDASGTWTETERGRATDKDLHATWIDPDGGIWTVGGQLLNDPPIRGTMIYGGLAEIPRYGADESP